jgi:hypothetical protein
MVAAAAFSAPAAAQGTLEVYITNLSSQVISRPVVVSHTWQAWLFAPGHEASPGLSLLAEDGDPSMLMEELEDNDQVFDMTVAPENLMPGATVVLEVEVRGHYNQISAVGMLVTTNDAFFGLGNYRIDYGRMVQRTTAPAWDSGTESNNELCAFIPGPPCGNKFVRDTEDAEGMVHVHNGIHGVGDLAPSAWDWRNPVVSISTAWK